MPTTPPIRRARSAAPLALLLLTGCAGVPGGAPAAVPLAPESLAAAQSLPADPAAAWPGEGWWRDIGDPQLTALVEEGLANSPDLAMALARWRNAAAVAQQAGGATLPSLDVQGDATFDKQSYNNGFPRAFMPQGWNDTGQLVASLGFDLDIWGRNRAALAAARGEARAAELEARQARLLLASGIAAAYVDLARLTAERDTHRAMLDARKGSRDLVGRRVAQGLDVRSNLLLAEAAAATSASDLAAAEEAIALRRHQIAVLLGAGPDRGLSIAAPVLPAVTAGGLPDGVTTALAGRRPDIAAARERVEAAAARVRVARADFFPAISLGALVGFQSLGLGNLLEADSSFGSVGPAVSLPVFRGGALRGQYRGVQAGYDAAVADYDRTVLAAYQQVADAVTSRAAQAARLVQLRAALAATQEARALAARRYEGGLATRIEVLSAEDRMLQARLAVNAVEAALRGSEIALIRSLGGGFAATANDAAKDETHD